MHLSLLHIKKFDDLYMINVICINHENKQKYIKNN